MPEDYYTAILKSELTALRAELAELREIARQLESSLREQIPSIYPLENCDCDVCKALRAFAAWEAKHVN